MKSSARFVLLPLCVLASGCYEVEEVGGVQVVSYATWAVGVAVLVALAALGTCARLVQLTIRDQWFSAQALGANALVAMVALLAGYFACALATDELVLDSDGAHDHCGFPWNRRWRGVRSLDVERVTFEHVTRGYGHRRETDTDWVLHHRDGSTELMSVGDLWDHAYDLIAEHLESQGVRMGTDPRVWGGASDDPFVVTFFDEEYRIDADSPKERLTALMHKGALFELRSPDDSADLVAMLDAGRDPVGTWAWSIVDGPREIVLEFEFDADGGLEHRAQKRVLSRGGELTSVELASLEGTYSVSETACNFDFGGASYSIVYSGSD